MPGSIPQASTRRGPNGSMKVCTSLAGLITMCTRHSAHRTWKPRQCLGRPSLLRKLSNTPLHVSAMVGSLVAGDRTSRNVRASNFLVRALRLIAYEALQLEDSVIVIDVRLRGSGLGRTPRLS